MTDKDLGEMARGLSKAQRGWLINPGYVDPNSMRALRRKGIVEPVMRRLTPLGLALRAHLQGETL